MDSKRSIHLNRGSEFAKSWYTKTIDFARRKSQNFDLSVRFGNSGMCQIVASTEDKNGNIVISEVCPLPWTVEFCEQILDDMKFIERKWGVFEDTGEFWTSHVWGRN